MKHSQTVAVYPDEILPPAYAGTLLEEVERVAELHKQGLNLFAIADRLYRPLRWVLDRIEMCQVDPVVLAGARPSDAEDLLRRLREETAPVLDLVPRTSFAGRAVDREIPIRAAS
ncbi:MAG: hypothetical protein PHP75_07180 [Methylacidiphilaceae bacterium]|nr:hypothetical protein [Candidatus Methylacidiphilaceae bacterium]